jgi:hypothetical protein
MSPPLVPSLDHDVHLVLCDFGEHGRAYVETDPAAADKDTIVRSMIAGQYDRPISVMAFNRAEGWAWDVSEDIARAVTKAAEREGRSLTEGTRIFVQEQLEPLDRPIADAPFPTVLQNYRDLASGVRLIREAVEQAFGARVLPSGELTSVTMFEKCEAIARAVYAAAGRQQTPSDT